MVDAVTKLGPILIGVLAILVVGLAGRRRDAALQLIAAHSELTNERTNGARGRLFRIMRGEDHMEVYAHLRSPDRGHREDNDPPPLEIDDYFVLLYAIEAAATAVDVACQRWGHDRLQRIAQPIRGVLPKKRARYLKWHLDATMQTVTKWRGTAARTGQLDDSGAFEQLQEHCTTLHHYGLLDSSLVPSRLDPEDERPGNEVRQSPAGDASTSGTTDFMAR